MAGTSPRVTGLEWGQVDTEAGAFRDAKLWPGGGRNWDWNETGTDHDPGVQAADVEELLDNGAETVVIGCGQQQRLGVTDEAVSAIEQRGASVDVAATADAIERYNELAVEGRAVGALIHSTC